MTAWEQTDVAEEDRSSGSRPWRVARIAALVAAILVAAGIGTGFIFAAIDHAHGFNMKQAGVLLGIALFLSGAGWLLVREFRASSGEEPLTSREGLNRNLLIASGGLGIVTGVIMIVAGDGNIANGGGVFSNEPLPPIVAALLLLLLGVVAPTIGFFWHRVVDEQEADAYKTGALYGMYVYGVGAPLWWLAWRGGFVPAPNGFIIYYATVITLGLVWFWKKYR